MCLKKKSRHALRSNCVRGPYGPPRWPPTGRHLTKIIFHIQVTFDCWWLYINVEKLLQEKCWENTIMNKTANFLFGIYYLIYSQHKNNHQLKFLVHQNRENAKSKWSLFRQNDARWKLMFRLYFLNRTLFFSFSFVNINVLEWCCYIPSLIKKFLWEMHFLSSGL